VRHSNRAASGRRRCSRAHCGEERGQDRHEADGAQPTEPLTEDADGDHGGRGRFGQDQGRRHSRGDLPQAVPVQQVGANSALDTQPDARANPAQAAPGAGTPAATPAATPAEGQTPAAATPEAGAPANGTTAPAATSEPGTAPASDTSTPADGKSGKKQKASKDKRKKS